MLTKFNGNLSPVFSSIWDNFFKGFDDDFLSQKSNFPATNFKEDDVNYYLEIAVPGFSKENFSVTIENGNLKISGQKEKSQEKYNRKEFSYESFERSFVIPEIVNEENLSATYKDGVLYVTLPKKENVSQKYQQRQIEIQ